MQPRSAQPRSSGSSDPVRARFDRFRLDEANASLMRDDTPVTLAPTPFAVLCALVRKPGSLLTKNALLDEVWGDRVFVEERTVDVHIRRLRQTFKPTGHEELLETVRGVGYRFRRSLPEAPGWSRQGSPADQVIGIG